MTRISYQDFVDDIDIDRLEEALGFEILYTKGNEDIGKCPDFWGLHQNGDTTGKFAINREKKVWHCFVCDGGNLLSLAMAFLKCDDEEATDWLWKLAQEGDTRSRVDFINDLLNVAVRHRIFKEKLPYFNTHALEQFKAKGEDHAFLLEWCNERGISWRTMGEYQLGYSPRHKKAAPRKNGEPIGEDYYGPCIVFPHHWKKQLVGWQHRWLNHGVDTPKWLGKYTNTLDFPKHSTLYNFTKALRLGEAVLVESVPTVLFLESLGITAVSAFGAGIKHQQLKELRHLHKIIIAPDNDPAGEEFVKACVEDLQDRVRLEVLHPLPGRGSDLGDLADCHDARGAVAEALADAYKPLPY